MPTVLGSQQHAFASAAASMLPYTHAYASMQVLRSATVQAPAACWSCTRGARLPAPPLHVQSWLLQCSAVLLTSIPGKGLQLCTYHANVCCWQACTHFCVAAGQQADGFQPA